MRILGVIFDDRFNFKEHLLECIRKAKKGLGALVAVSGMYGGPSPQVVRAVYNGYVEVHARCNVAINFTYGPAGMKNQLEQILIQGSKLVAGLPRRTATDVVTATAGTWNLGELFFLHGSMVVERALRGPDVALGKLLQPRPAPHANSVISKILESLDRCFPAHLLQRDVWLDRREIATLLPNWGRVRAETSTILSQQAYDDTAAGYDLIVDTDGSVTDPKRFGSTGNRGGLAWRLDVPTQGVPSRNSGFGGYCVHSTNVERRALVEGALAAEAAVQQTSFRKRLIQVGARTDKGGRREAVLEKPAENARRCPRVMFATDSLSLIISIQSMKPKTHEELRLFLLLNSLAKANSVQIHHVKGHARIISNEEADTDAKAGTARERVEDRPWTLPIEGVRAELKQLILDKRRERLAVRAKTSSRSAYFLAATEGLETATISTKGLNPRWESSIAAQLRSGQCPALADKAARSYEEGTYHVPHCKYCESAPEGGYSAPSLIEHYVRECQCFKKEREEHLPPLLQQQTTMGPHLPAVSLVGIASSNPPST